METLRQAALAADLSFQGSPNGRQLLLAAVTELVDARLVTLPSGNAGWDAAPRPALPRWVARVVVAQPVRAAETPVSWHAALSWVPAFLTSERPSNGERALLRATNDFLGSGGSSLVVPVRERSLQLTGDEKALDTLSRGRLFAAGRLSLELLSARRTSPPLARQHVGDGPITLLVENWSTYNSLAATLPADGEVGIVVYSAGNTVGTVLTALVDDLPTALAYFGDLDVRGLEMPAAADKLGNDLGLPPLRPAGVLYRLLLENGRAACTTTSADSGRIDRAVAWLPAPMRPAASQILASGQRVAQEAVGLELLTVTPPAALSTIV